MNDRDAIPSSDLRPLLVALAREGDRSRWFTALLQGMRQGECLGLTWDAINWDDNTIDVSWQLQPLPYANQRDHSQGFRVPDGFEARHLTHSYHLIRPKTASGRRVIPMLPLTRAALEQWRHEAPPNPWGLVWADTDTRNGRNRPTPRRGEKDRARWAEFQSTLGIAHPTGRPYKVHECRHTTATLMLEAKVDTEVMTKLIGHSKISTTRGYQHVSGQLLRDAVQGMASHLEITSA